MLKEKNYSAVDNVFLAAFPERVTRRTDMPLLNANNSLYSDIFNQLLSCNANFKKKRVTDAMASERIQKPKPLSGDIFGDVPFINVLSQNFCLLDQIAEGVSQIENLQFLDASPFDLFNYIIKRLFINTFMRLGSTMEKAVAILNTSLADEECSGISDVGKETRKLVKDRISSTQRTLVFQSLHPQFCFTGLQEKNSACKVWKLFKITVEGIYTDFAYAPWKAKQFRVVMVEVKENTFWFSQKLFSTYHNTRSYDLTSVKFQFVWYYDINASNSNIDLVLNCLSVRGETDDEVNYGVTQSVSVACVVKTRKFCGLASFKSVMSLHRIVRTIYSVSPFTPQVSWQLHRIYVNRFYQPRL